MPVRFFCTEFPIKSHCSRWDTRFPGWNPAESWGSVGKEQMFLNVWAECRGQSLVSGSMLPQRKGLSQLLPSAACWAARLPYGNSNSATTLQSECLVSALVHAKEHYRPALFFFFLYFLSFWSYAEYRATSLFIESPEVLSVLS